MFNETNPSGKREIAKEGQIGSSVSAELWTNFNLHRDQREF